MDENAYNFTHTLKLSSGDVGVTAPESYGEENKWWEEEEEKQGRMRISTKLVQFPPSLSNLFGQQECLVDPLQRGGQFSTQHLISTNLQPHQSVRECTASIK